MLVAGRMFQGLAAAVVAATAIALLVDTVGEREIGQSLGYVQIAISLGPMLGPLFGGIAFEKSGYYSVFALAFALVGLDVFLRLTLVEKKIAAKWTSPAETGNGEAGINQSESEIARGSTQRDRPRRDSPHASLEEKDVVKDLSPEPRAPSGLKRLTSRLPPVVTLLGSPRLLSALWGCFVQAALISAFDGVLPLFVRDTFQWDAIGAGQFSNLPSKR